MEEKLQKVRERLVKEKRERRDKASSLIELLRKSKIITKEETEEIRKKIIDNFNNKEDTGVYEEVNKKFHGVRKIRREIAKINKEIKGEKDKLVELDEEIEEIKKINLRSLSDKDCEKKREQYLSLLNQKKEVQRKIDELSQMKQNKKKEEKEVGDILWVDAKDMDEEIKEEKRWRKVRVTPIETEEVRMKDVPMKELWKKQKRWRFFWWDEEIEENTVVDEEDAEIYTPKMYYKQKESELRALEEDYGGVKEKLWEDIYLDEWYKTDLLSKLTERYNKSKEEIENDERYKEIKEKKESLKRKLEEMEQKKIEKEKEIEEIGKEIRKIKSWDISDEDKAREFDLVLEEKKLSLVKEDLVEEIKKSKEEYWEYEKEDTSHDKIWKKEMDKSWIIYRAEIWWKTLVVKNVFMSGKTEPWKCVKWWWKKIWEYEDICEVQDSKASTPLFCEVEWKLMFWVRGKKWNCKLIWWNEEYNEIKLESYNLKEIWWKPCIKIRKKRNKEVVIWWDKQIWAEYQYTSDDIYEAWWKPYFWAKKDWVIDEIRWDKELLWYSTKSRRVVWWKPFFVVENSGGKYEVVWWKERIWGEYKEVDNVGNAWWKPCFVVRNEKGRYEVVWWKEKIWGEYEYVEKMVSIWWKPCFLAKKRGNWIVMRWNEQIWEEYSRIWNDDVGDIWWKPCFRACIGLNGWIVMWWEKQIWGIYYEPSYLDDYYRTAQIWKTMEWKPRFKYRDKRGGYHMVKVISDSWEIEEQ